MSEKHPTDKEMIKSLRSIGLHLAADRMAFLSEFHKERTPHPKSLSDQRVAYNQVIPLEGLTLDLVGWITQRALRVVDDDYDALDLSTLVVEIYQRRNFPLGQDSLMLSVRAINPGPDTSSEPTG